MNKFNNNNSNDQHSLIIIHIIQSLFTPICKILRIQNASIIHAEWS